MVCRVKIGGNSWFPVGQPIGSGVTNVHHFDSDCKLKKISAYPWVKTYRWQPELSKLIHNTGTETGASPDVSNIGCQISYVFVAGRSVRVWGLKRPQKINNVSIS